MTAPEADAGREEAAPRNKPRAEKPANSGRERRRGAKPRRERRRRRRPTRSLPRPRPRSRAAKKAAKKPAAKKASAAKQPVRRRKTPRRAAPAKRRAAKRACRQTGAAGSFARTRATCAPRRARRGWSAATCAASRCRRHALSSRSPLVTWRATGASCSSRRSPTPRQPRAARGRSDRPGGLRRRRADDQALPAARAWDARRRSASAPAT